MPGSCQCHPSLVHFSILNQPPDGLLLDCSSYVWQALTVRHACTPSIARARLASSPLLLPALAFLFLSHLLAPVSPTLQFATDRYGSNWCWNGRRVSRGAATGVAIACFIIFLLFIVLLYFYLVRRRQQTRQGVSALSLPALSWQAACCAGTKAVATMKGALQATIAQPMSVHAAACNVLSSLHSSPFTVSHSAASMLEAAAPCTSKYWH